MNSASSIHKQWSQDKRRASFAKVVLRRVSLCLLVHRTIITNGGSSVTAFLVSPPASCGRTWQTKGNGLYHDRMDGSDSTTTEEKIDLNKKPWCYHPIDYSAANEFIQEHYHHIFDDNLYFEQGVESGPFDENNHDKNKPMEPIYNARNGIPNRNFAQATIPDDGFTLLRAPSQVRDWTDLQDIKSTYLRELETLILMKILSKDEVENLSHVVFWNPMFRGEKQTVSNVERNMNHAHPPTSPTAGMVHIDQDVGAYDAQDIVRLIKNNAIVMDDREETDFEEIVEAVENGHRFAIINFWRNADPDNPIRRQPLAVYSPYYNQQNKEQPERFPNAKPDTEESCWYTYPEMTTDEVLVFKQYDRDASYPSDVWHCALKSIIDETAPPRKSFDIRAFLVFQTKPQSDSSDRFSEQRIRPVLNYEESGEFCNQQAAKRGL